MGENSDAWETEHGQQRSPKSGEFKQVDTNRSDDGSFRSPGNILLEELTVGQAMTTIELARTTDISETTVIEHLNRLQNQALVEEDGGGWTLAHDSERVDPVVERHRQNREEAANWEYEDDDSIY